MSDADLLRRAAQLARETAEAAPRGPHTVDTTEEAPADATDRDKILRIVAVWVDTAARTAVTDIDDLIWDLKQAGYTLPDPTEHPKEE